MPILSSSDWPSVRALLDVSLDDQALPDEVIELDVYADAAEAWGVDRDPGIAGLTGDDLARAKRALCYYLAALLAPALPALVSETLGDYRYQRSAWDGQAVAVRLRQLAADTLGALTEPGAVPGVAGIFGAAVGHRVVGRRWQRDPVTGGQTWSNWQGGS